MQIERQAGTHLVPPIPHHLSVHQEIVRRFLLEALQAEPGHILNGQLRAQMVEQEVVVARKEMHFDALTQDLR